MTGSREVLPVRRVRTCDWPGRLCAMISCMGLRSGSRAQPRSKEAEMTEPGSVLEAVHTAIADLAAVLVAVRSGLGGDCVRAGSHLEMGEIDLLSARDAVEKARFPWGRSCCGARHPRGFPSLPARRCDPGCRAGVGLGRGGTGSRDTARESLFSVHDVTSRALQLA